MTTSQLPLPTAQRHHNQQLFSDYFLNITLPQNPNWRLMAADAQPVMASIAAIFAAYSPSTNEAQTEHGLVRPILQALGHTFEVQTALQTPDGTKKPDYILYRDDAALLANKNKVLDDALLHGRAFAVGDAKYWERPLDVAIKTGGDPFTNKNPSYQIAFYIQHSGVDWGILTNGRLWRLYHRDTAHKLDRFYEVDLPALLDTGDAEAFLYFYGFFHRSAFEPHPLGVAALLRASVEYARGVGDTLKTQVYDALRHLAQGFLDYTPNQLSTDQTTLKAIYDNSLIVLYRLLFILYAEARALLPISASEMYRESYSLYALKGTVANDLRMDKRLLPTSATLWPRLTALFTIINEGSPPLKVATFNGGLFDPARHPFLNRYTVGDAHLQQAIDQLARVDEQFVDYRDLDERHLGTIYEGLLEFQLHPVSPEDEWTVVLLNDKGERKATGSYYTPDYIVKYIVDQTVGPALQSAVTGLHDDKAKIAAILGTNVLDPAMGSGHFLVEVTEYIARFLVDLAIVPGADAGGEADLQYWKRRVVQSCIYGVDLNPLAVELAKLSLWLSTVAKDRPLSFLDHHLRTGNALVGARIADLSVGSSGAEGQKRRSRQAKQAAVGQISMLDDEGFRQSMSTAVGSMWLIEGSAGSTVGEVKEQERIYADLREILTRKYGRLADLVTATHFGLKVDSTMWHPLADFATGRTLAAPPRFTTWLEQADSIATLRHFFHWELEFPEVFFDRHGQPLGEKAGFDAVVGNPPYINAMELDRTLSDYEKPLWKKRFKAAQGAYDIYILFIEQCLDLVQFNGGIGLITPNKYLAAPYAVALRKYIIDSHTIIKLRDLSRIRVFEDASVYPIVSIIRRGQVTKPYMTSIEQVHPNEVRYFVHSSDLLETMPDCIWGFLLAEEGPLLQNILRLCDPIDKISQVNASTTAAEADSYSHYLLEDGSVPAEERWKIVNTGLIDRYTTSWGQSTLTHQHTQYQHPILPKQSPAVTRNRREQFSRPKLIFAKMALRIEAFIDMEGVYASMNTNFVIGDLEGYTNLFLGALCNCSLLSWVYDQYFRALKMSGGYYQFQAPQIRTLPIRRIIFATPDEERERLRAKGKALYEQFCAKDDYACVLGFVEHHLPRLPDGTPDTTNEHSDVIHDLLAYLAQQMIDLNKQRQVAVEDLVLDLEGVLSTGDMQKIGRLWTPLRATKAADDVEAVQKRADAQQELGTLAEQRLELRDHIGAISESQWKWLLKGRLKHIDNLSDLVKVYRRRQPAIATLDHQLAATDELINRIVYRLYGLNDNEIRIIEEK